MASGIDKLAKQIADIIKKDEQTKGYDTTATVTRIDGRTAWVHIPGGVDETPVKMTVNAKAGDSVQVRVSGGRAFLVGNGSAPPTDDSGARALHKLSSKAIKAVSEVANNAFKIAGNTAQYFWTTETGNDTGAHITEVPKEEFLADPTNSGANLLLRSIGIAIRYGLTELASFGTNGISIGTDNNTKITLDTTNGLKLGQNVQVNTSGDASFTGTITGSAGEFTKSFKVNTPLSQGSAYSFELEASENNNGMSAIVSDGTNEAALELQKAGGAGLYGKNAVILASFGQINMNCSGDKLNIDPTKIETLNYFGGMGVPITSDDTVNHRVSHFYMDSASQLQVKAQGNSSSYSTYNIATSSSDARLKKNVEPCEVDALKLIKAVQMRKFDWENTGDHQEIGFVADELEQLDPKLAVGGGWKDDKTMSIKSVDTFYLMGYMVKAIQELSDEVDRLKGVIK